MQRMTVILLRMIVGLFLPLATVVTGFFTDTHNAWATPAVGSYQPANNAIVPVTQTMQATFSEAMNPDTITTGSFTLSKFVGIKAIAAGGSHTVALKNDGSVVAWGHNWYGQTTVPAGLTGVTAIAAGYYHTVALKNDGTAVAWGYNGSGQTTVPVGLTGVTSIVAGDYHTVALKSDGTVVAWGHNGYGQTTVPTGLTGVTAIAAGDYHTVALKNDGTVVAWGANGYGQTTIPAGLTGVTAISAGYSHTVALKSDGTVVAWGDNGYGQTTVPAGLSGVTAISAGYSHTVALKSDGTVVAWGYNGSGQTTVPAGLSGVAAIAAGNLHTVVLKGDGTVVAWGDNGYGQITVPAGLRGVTAIAAGGSHTVALKIDGTAVAWGDNGSGQTTVPAGLSGVTAISAGYSHTVALKSDGTVVAWGANGYGQTTVPAGLAGVTSIGAGDSHTVALKIDGTVVAWGFNGSGQTAVPAGLAGVTAIAAGVYHTVALKSDGTVVAWGANGYGQTTVPAGLTGVTGIAAGYHHTVALKSDGTVVAWGHNGSGQTTVPAGLTGVTAIAAGDYHTVALKSDGTVVAWGHNGFGQTTMPAGLVGVTGIAAGYYHTVALKNDGTVIAWGYNESGQTTVSPVSAYETAVNGSVIYSPDTLTASFIPALSHLDYGALYYAAITGVRSQSGVPFAASAQWSFATSDRILWGFPTAYDFGSVIINTTLTSKTFTISNTNATNPVAGAITINGPDASLFTLTPGSCESLSPTIPARGSCTVDVAFMPVSAGSRNAVLQVSSPDPVNQTYGIPLSGSGVPQSFTLSVTVGGTGSGAVHSSPDTDLNCTNGGCAQSYELGTSVTLSAAANSGSAFTGWNGACSGIGTCNVAMDAARSVTAIFTADPVDATIGVSPASLTFSNLVTFSSDTQSVTISNGGTVPLVVANAVLSGTDAGAFIVAPGTCGSTRPVIVPGGSCQLDLIFQSATPGSKSTTFTITSNASNSPNTAITITGSAYDPPPFGYISINGGAALTNSLSVTLSLSAYDNSGQVSYMRFSNNNSSWSGWEMFASTKNWTLLALGGDGGKTVYVQYKDAADNASGSFAGIITLDTTPPVVTITARPASPYPSRSGTYGFIASEAVSGFECNLDSGTFAPCSSPFSFSGVSDGSHTFYVRSTDMAGNLGSTVSGNWIIDATPPETVISTMPGTPTNSTSGSFSFTSPDSAATFECSLDSAAFVACVNPYMFSGLADGIHSFSVRAKDATGNYDPTPASYSWIIDTTPPDTAITAQPLNPAAANSGSFNFSSTETGSTFQCSLDGAAYAPCSTPFSFNGLADGIHTFSVMAKDAAVNYDPTPASYSWTIDTTPPDTAITAQPPNPAAANSGNFTFFSTETGSTFQCKVDGAAYTPCSSPYSFSGLTNASHTFSVRALDALGNTDPTPASYTWTVNVTTPQNVKLSASGRPDTFFSTIGAAFTAAPASAPSLLLTQVMTFAENIVINTCGAVVTMSGSYSLGFITIAGPTIVQGSITVACGTLIAENLVIL